MPQTHRTELIKSATAGEIFSERVDQDIVFEVPVTLDNAGAIVREVMQQMAAQGGLPLPDQRYNRVFCVASDGASVALVKHQDVGQRIRFKLTPSTLSPADILPWALPGHNPHFVGRTKELDTLAGQLQQGQHTVIGQSVSGLGGVGKTQLALAFAHRHKPKDRRTQQDDHHHYQAVLWLNAANLTQETINLAKALKLNPQEQQGAALCTKIYHTLAQLGESILLVFDNAKDQATLADWAQALSSYQSPNHQEAPTPASFHLLVTSRSQHWTIWQPLTLKVFTPEEARAFVLKRLPNENPEAANTLAGLVYHLPLALAQAVAYIAARPDRRIANYCKMYQASAENQRILLKKSLEPGSTQGDYFPKDAQRAVYLTWYLSIEELQKDCPLAVTVLNLAAFLAPRGIPTALFSDGLQNEGLLSLDELTWEETCEQLQRYSLVTYHPEAALIDKRTQPPRLDIHQLVQEVIRLQLQQQFLTDNNAERHLKGLPLQPEAITEPHQNESPTKITHCYDRYGAYVLAKMAPLSRYDTANAVSLQLANSLYAHSEQIARLAEKADWDKPLTAGLWGELGNYQQEVVGNARAGRDCQEHALAINEAHHGKDHVEVARTLNNLATAYGDLGDSQAKKDALERALPLLKKYYGPEHPDVATAYGNFGNAYGALGDHQTKKTMLERALRLKEAYYGQDHVEVARTLNNLATAYGDLGDSQAKKDTLERALPLLEKHYGSEHPTVAKATDNLANAYGALGDHQTKKTMLERALRLKEAYYGKDHVEVARTLNNLAGAYAGLGDSQAQKDRLERALPLLEKHYGAEHPDVAKAYNNLASAYGDLGDHQTKKATLERALPLLEKHYGPEHPAVAVATDNLANAYGALGDHQTKKTMLERDLALKEAYYGQDHVEVAITLGNLANAYGALGDHQTKKSMLERTLRLNEAYYGQGHIEVAITLNNLALAYGALRDHAAMKATLAQVLVVYKNYYGPNHVEVANIESNLAIACAVTGALDRAQALAEHAYQCYANTPGYGLPHPEAQRIAGLRQHISQLMASNIPLTQPRPAPDMLDGLIAALNAYQPQSPQPADTMRDLARAYQLKGDNTQAIACFKQSIATQPHPLTYVDLGYGLLRQQQPARALKCVSEVLALSLAKRQAHRVRYGWREVNTLFDDSLKACANSEGEVRLSITDWAYYVAIQCHRALSQYPQAQQQLAAWQSIATTSKAGRQLWQACQAELGPQTAADTTKPTTPPMRLSQSKDTLFGHPETKTEPPPTEPAHQASHPMTHQSQLGDKASSLAPA